MPAGVKRLLFERGRANRVCCACRGQRHRPFNVPKGRVARDGRQVVPRQVPGDQGKVDAVDDPVTERSGPGLRDGLDLKLGTSAPASRSQPLRIAATVVLTPLVAKVHERVTRGRGRRR